MQNIEFDVLYKKLNPAQKKAVDTIDGPVMVIAGPGTGKTSILSLRIANILRKTDTPANGILAITYTDSGVKAMRYKLHNIIGDRAHDIRIHTFHGFASSVIAEYPDHFLHMNGMKQMTDIDQETLIRSILSDAKFQELRPAGKPDVYVSGIIRTIDDAKREALTPKSIRQYARDEIKRIENDESSISTRGRTKGQLKAEAMENIEKCKKTVLFAEIYEIYESKKREANKIDFNDLIIELLLALRNDELLLRLLQEKYLYIHVDEHQDTNDVQNFIIGLIADFFETPNIFIVGDEKQAIYRFQGASVENFMMLQKKWPKMEMIHLDINYRSHQGILDASFGMIEKNYEDDEQNKLHIKLQSASKDKIKQIDIVTGGNTSASEKYLIDELKRITRNEPKSTISIIVRRNRDLDRIIQLLESHNIPVSSERSINIFNHPVGRVFFDLMQYIIDPSRLDLLSKTIVSGLWNLSFEDGIDIIKNLKSGKSIDLNKKLTDLKNIKGHMFVDSPVGFIIYLAEKSHFLSIISRDPSYIYVWRGIIRLAESISKDSDIHDPEKLIDEMIAYRISSESRIVKVSIGAPDTSIHALTAHGSKGLEFDHVFIPYANEESWIGRPHGASFILPKKRTQDNDIKDIRRLFYVAVTRAKKHVVILTSSEESDGKILTPLRFLDELDKDNICHITLPISTTDQVYSTKFLNNKDRHQKIILDLTKRILTEKGLSVTALNHFIKCPNLFLYQSILKLPQAPSISAEKGSAMHFALDYVWKSKKNTSTDLEAMISGKILEYFENSLLSIADQDHAKKELLDDVKFVSKALKPHFAQYASFPVFTELWVETEFKIKNAGKIISIPLHGKLDAIVGTDKGVFVFDYKTRQAMSINEIKGLTKNSDGNYFRQLVFYKILVSADQRWKYNEIIPSLVFVSPDRQGKCPIITLPIEDSDISDVEKEIQSLVDSVWSGQIVKIKCNDIKCEWCGMRDL